MGITEVMIVVGGKSVGDVVELLGRRRPLRARPDVSLPARARSGSPTPSAWPASSSAATRSAWSSATTSCAGPTLARGRPRVRGGPLGRRHAPLPGPGSRALRRRRAVADGRGRRLRGEARRRPRATSSRSACTSCARARSPVIESLALSGRGEFEITDVLNHYIPDGRFFAREYEGHWTDAGTVPSLLRAAELAAEAEREGRLVAPVARPIAEMGDRSRAFDRPHRTCWSPAAPGFIGSRVRPRVLARRDGRGSRSSTS